MKINNFSFQNLFALVFATLLLACGNANSASPKIIIDNMSEKSNEVNTNDTSAFAVLGGGCFWCTEAQYLMLPGVSKVESGYAGGNTTNPTYKDICTGTTNHAEVVRVTYNPQVISYDEILAAFWLAHDPTTLNRQGADVGTQYRSIILYTTELEREKAMAYIKKLNEAKAYDNPIVTEVKALDVFYVAEDYHQNYYYNNKAQPYCQMVIQPKVDKFQKIFSNK